jgi:hypothetical protein
VTNDRLTWTSRGVCPATPTDTARPLLPPVVWGGGAGSSAACASCAAARWQLRVRAREILAIDAGCLHSIGLPALSERFCQLSGAAPCADSHSSSAVERQQVQGEAGSALLLPWSVRDWSSLLRCTAAANARAVAPPSSLELDPPPPPPPRWLRCRPSRSSVCCCASTGARARPPLAPMPLWPMSRTRSLRVTMRFCQLSGACLSVEPGDPFSHRQRPCPSSSATPSAPRSPMLDSTSDSSVRPGRWIRAPSSPATAGRAALPAYPSSPSGPGPVVPWRSSAPRSEHKHRAPLRRAIRSPQRPIPRPTRGGGRGGAPMGLAPRWSRRSVPSSRAWSAAASASAPGVVMLCDQPPRHRRPTPRGLAGGTTRAHGNVGRGEWARAERRDR